jgi:hypothetical protein
MRVPHIVCAILACAALTLEARATASSEDDRQSGANVDRAAGRAESSRDAGTKPARTNGRDSTQTGARKGAGSKGQDAGVADSPSRGSATPQRGVGQSARGNGNADRLRSLLNAQAQAHPTRRQPGRAVRPTGAAKGAATGAATRSATGAVTGAATGTASRAATGTATGAATGTATSAATRGAGARVPQGVTPAGQPKLATSNSVASPVPRLTATPRGSIIGGPHAQGSGRVGGPAISRTTRSATIDGTRPPHKS